MEQWEAQSDGFPKYACTSNGERNFKASRDSTSLLSFLEVLFLTGQIWPISATIIGSSANGPVRKAKIELPVGGGDSVSMSSLEISELTGSRHDKVKQSIERLATKGVISLPPTGGVKVQRERREETVEAYLFTGDKGRRDSIIVVAQLCPEFTATIIHRWQEIEAQQKDDPILGNVREEEDAHGYTSLFHLDREIKPEARQAMSSTLALSAMAAEDPDVRTMSSREIAELTEKQHKHVMRDIRTMMEALEQSPELDSVCKTTTYSGSSGQKYEQYELDKDTCLTLLLGYDPVARMKVVKRWRELEAQQTQPAATPYGEMPVPMSQMLTMLSEGYGKLEQELQRQAQKIDSLSATMQLLQRPAPKLRTKDPSRIPGPLDWQVGKTIKSIRFNFSIAPHEIGLERFYLHLHGLTTEGERADALRTALHLGIKLDNALPLNFPDDAKSIRFKVGFSEEKDRQLQDVLEMLLPLANDKDRRIAIKRYLVNKSSAAPQTFMVSVTPAQSHPNQPGLF